MKKLVIIALFFVSSTAQAIVNPRNGNFYLPLPDYYQSCFGYPLEVYRSYNSFSTRNGPFGPGWTFNYDIQIVVGEKGGLQISEPDGFVNQYVSIEQAEQSPAAVIPKIIDAKKAEDVAYLKKKEGKGEAYYKDIEQKLHKDSEFLKRQQERYLGATKTKSESGKYVSYNRGTSYVTKTSSGYTRVTATGQQEEYNTEGGITRIADRNNNELRFNYDKKSRLNKVFDGCGNYIEITYAPNDKISKIKDSYSQELNYEYDNTLRLISSKGVDKQSIQYGYDNIGRMTTLTFSSDKSVTTITYDPKNGRVTAQDGPGKKHTTYEYDKTPGTISTRVKDNEGENTLYEYIDKENKVRQTATLPARPSENLSISQPATKAEARTITTTTILSACCGKPILIETSTGVKDKFEYDKDGNLTARIDSKGDKTTFEYEPRFSMISEIKDSSGETIRYRYDQKGNLTFAKKTAPGANGASTFVKMTYEEHGKLNNIIDDQDQEVKFTYSRLGKSSSIELWKNKKKTSEIRVEYTSDGTMSNLLYVPNNPETAELIRRTLANYLMLLKPAGVDFEI